MLKNMLYIIFYILITYLTAVFLLSRFIVPHLGLKNEDIPDKIPPNMEKTIKDLSAKSNSPYEFLENSYTYIGSKYHAERLKTFLLFGDLFKPLSEIWKKDGFAHCTQLCYIMKIFLIKSGFFSPSDIKTKHTFVNLCIHQYLQVKIDKNWIDVDVGEKSNNMTIGNHLKWFG